MDMVDVCKPLKFSISRILQRDKNTIPVQKKLAALGYLKPTLTTVTLNSKTSPQFHNILEIKIKIPKTSVKNGIEVC